MPRILYRDEWFFELSPTALGEAEFERILIQNASILWPNEIVVPFKKTVHAGDSSARGDLVALSRDYRSWSVIEVEATRHSLESHVIPQVRVLQQARYEPEHARHIANACADLEAERVGMTLRGDPPEVVVVVDRYDPQWDRELKRHGAHMIVLQVFRSDANRRILLIDGEVPGPPPGIITELLPGPLPRFLKVAAPAALGFGPGELVPIMVDGRLTFWQRFDTAGDCYISPMGVSPVERDQRYALVRVEGGHYAIRRSRRIGGVL